MNFIKQITQFFKGKPDASGKYQLKDSQKAKIYDIISKSGDFVSKYGKGIEGINNPATGSVTYNLDEAFEEFNTKSEIGQGAVSTFVESGLSQKTLYMSKTPRVAKGILDNIAAKIFPTRAAKKMAKATNQDMKLWNRKFFNIVSADTATYADGQTITAGKPSANHRVVFIPSDLSKEENIRIAWNQMSALRKIISLHKDYDQGIDNMDEESIVGDIDNWLSRAFNQLGFGSASPEKFIAGTEIKKIATFSGLDMNKYINEVTITGNFDGTASATYNVAGMLGTNLSYKFPLKIEVANSGNIDNLSGAKGYFYQSRMGATKNAAGAIVDNTPFELLGNTIWLLVYVDTFDTAKHLLLPTKTAVGGGKFIGAGQATN